MITRPDVGSVAWDSGYLRPPGAIALTLICPFRSTARFFVNPTMAAFADAYQLPPATQTNISDPEDDYISDGAILTASKDSAYDRRDIHNPSALSRLRLEEGRSGIMNHLHRGVRHLKERPRLPNGDGPSVVHEHVRLPDLESISHGGLHCLLVRNVARYGVDPRREATSVLLGPLSSLFGNVPAGDLVALFGG